MGLEIICVDTVMSVNDWGLHIAKRACNDKYTMVQSTTTYSPYFFPMKVFQTAFNPPPSSSLSSG